MLKENTSNAKEYRFCRQWADEYNAKMELLDFLRPQSLTLVAAYENFIIAYKNEDKWLNENIKEGIDALIDYQETHEDELIDFYDYDKDESYVSPYDELSEILLSDKDFRYCTNKTKRGLYMRDFLKREKNKKYLLIFRGAKDKFDREYRLANLFDQIYDEYKGKCHSLKIRVGEPLPVED